MLISIILIIIKNKWVNNKKNHNKNKFKVCVYKKKVWFVFIISNKFKFK